MAIQIPQDILLGEDKSWLITVVNKADKSRFNLSGVLLEFQVKVLEGDADPPLIFKKSTISSEIAILDQTVGSLTEGQATITVLSADTLAPFPEAGFYRYDLVIVEGTGDRRFLIPPSDFDVRAVVNPPP